MYPQSMLWAKKRKISSSFFHIIIFIFIVVKNYVILYRLVIVMDTCSNLKEILTSSKDTLADLCYNVHL